MSTVSHNSIKICNLVLRSMLLTAPLVAIAMTLTVLSGIVVFANYAGIINFRMILNSN